VSAIRNAIPALRRLDPEIQDAIDGFEMRWSIALSRLHCFFVGHEIKDDQSSYDGEWYVYCERCEGEETNKSAVASGYLNTVPGVALRLQYWILTRFSA
jgi:hypothetical protein